MSGLFGIRIGGTGSSLGNRDRLLVCVIKSFSSIFEMIDSRLIGLYEVTSVGSFPGFSIMITLDV